MVSDDLAQLVQVPFDKPVPIDPIVLEPLPAVVRIRDAAGMSN